MVKVMKKNSSSEHKYLTYEETTFLGLLSISGIKVFKNWSLFWASFFTAWIVLFSWNNGTLYENLITISASLTAVMLGASAGIFGIVIAALTLTVALFHQSLLPKMLEKKLLHKYLFPFWKAVVLWAMNIVLCILLIIFNILKVNCFIIPTIIFEVFIFLYATFYTVKLTGVVIQLALQRAQIKD
jgi:hypothetical protein